MNKKYIVGDIWVQYFPDSPKDKLYFVVTKVNFFTEEYQATIDFKPIEEYSSKSRLEILCGHYFCCGNSWCHNCHLVKRSKLGRLLYE